MTHRGRNVFIAIWILPLWFFTCNVAPKSKEAHRQPVTVESPYQAFDSALRQAYAHSDSNAKALSEAIKAAKATRVTIIYSRDTLRITPHPFGGGYK